MLHFFEEGSYEDSGGQIWFGEGLGGCLPDEMLDEVDRLAADLGRMASESLSELASRERTSLRADTKLPGKLRLVLGLLEKVSARRRVPPDPDRMNEDEVADAIDRYYAAETIGKLEEVVSRAVTLKRISMPVLPNERVKIVFEEAHRCYLYGFHLACAVCCRSVLEMALKETVDPDGQLKKQLRSPSGAEGKSYIIEMAKEAARRELVPPSTNECAKLVKGAGDAAIHNPDGFSRLYPESTITDVLLRTRTTLEQLYRLRVSE